MAKRSAGLLMYRVREDRIEALFVHLGGPFWARKDAGAWFIPKGEMEPGESELASAKREFQEETGLKVGDASFIDLGETKHNSGKTVRAWAYEGDCDPEAIQSNTFSMEWPPKSGKQKSFPEVDRARFMGLIEAKEKVHPAEYLLLERLVRILNRAV